MQASESKAPVAPFKTSLRVWIHFDDVAPPRSAGSGIARNVVNAISLLPTLRKKARRVRFVFLLLN
jgi:hypothetical protein